MQSCKMTKTRMKTALLHTFNPLPPPTKNLEVEGVARMGNETKEREIEGVNSETEGLDSENDGLDNRFIPL